VAAPILLAKMNDGGSRLGVDYCALNLATVKNRYPVPLTSETLDSVCKAKILTKLDYRSLYTLIRIKDGNEYMMAVSMCYDQFEYQLTPYGLTNAPVIFQSHINDSLRPYIDDFIVCYLYDILIYSTNEKGHEQHVRQALQRLWEFSLCCRAEKCQFGILEDCFLGIVITPDGVGMELD
jgi:hypothetical protein